MLALAQRFVKRLTDPGSVSWLDSSKGDKPYAKAFEMAVSKSYRLPTSMAAAGTGDDSPVHKRRSVGSPDSEDAGSMWNLHPPRSKII